jgi:hypothetical protein
MLIPIRNMIPKVIIPRLFISLVGIFMLNLWFSDVNRLRCRLDRIFEYEMRLFEDMLHDLLPMTGTISSRSSGEAACTSVCNFGKNQSSNSLKIVAAWLTPNKAEGANRASTEFTGVRNLCHSIMWLAGMMLNTLDSHRQQKQGHRLSARFGVAVGQVVVGSLGSMQARIHIRGYV